MEQKALRSCLKIMKLLMNHPITIPFHYPVPTGESSPPRYFEIIAHPIDLGTISENIQNQKYIRFSQISDDVELVWKNAETYNEPGSIICVCANEGRKIFKKICRENTIFMMNSWCSESSRLRQSINSLISKPPFKVRQSTSLLVPQRAPRSNIPLFTEKDMQNFVIASQMLNYPSNQQEMFRIINENQPELDNGSEELVLDVTKLSLTTLHAIKDYIKAALEKKNMKYPE